MRSRKPRPGRPAKEPTKKVVGIAWYYPEQWKRLRQTAADPEKLEKTFEEWVTTATRLAGELEAEGITVERIPVDVEEFITWCNEQGRVIDSSSRAEYASQLLLKRHQDD
jgi:hypothetical protein